MVIKTKSKYRKDIVIVYEKLTVKENIYTKQRDTYEGITSEYIMPIDHTIPAVARYEIKGIPYMALWKPSEQKWVIYHWE